MPDREYTIKITTETEQVAAGAKRASEALKNLDFNVKQTDQSLKEQTVTTQKLGNAKKNLKDLVKGAAMEFPILGHAAKLAMNPLVGLAAAVTAGFSLWRTRVEGLKESMSSVEIPDSVRDLGSIARSGEESWQRFAEALAQVLESYNSLDAAHKREIESIDKEAERKKKMLEANKALELSQPGADATEIEARYGRAMGGLSAETEAQKMAEREKLLAAKKAQLAAADAEEAGIRVAPESIDAANEKTLKEQRDAARASLDKRIGRMANLRELASGGGVDPITWTQMLFRYGPTNMDPNQGGPQRMLAQEEAQAADERGRIERYQRFIGAAPGRADLRARKAQLSTLRGKLSGEIPVLEAEIASARAIASADRGVDAYTSTAGALTKTNEARAKAEVEVRKLESEAAAQVERVGAVASSLQRALRDATARVAALERRQQEMDSQLRGTRNQR